MTRRFLILKRTTSDGVLAAATTERPLARSSVHQAAVALNHCATSISSIIHSSDTVILDQEYNAILNNLNIGACVKDEALLSLFKRLLNTLTNLRLLTGDREWVQREYENNMRNAVFNSLPQFNLILAGANPWTALLGAVHQVGVSYFNYRRNKIQYQQGRDRSLWELQKVQIEELHGLRTEWFEASWRLCDRYSIPDEWRLTQKQVDNYLSALDDTDDDSVVRRMDYMEEEFYAYPPFWFNKAEAALRLASKAKGDGDYDLRERSLTTAHSALARFGEIWTPLLRHDLVAASADIAHVRLLDPACDEPRIRELLAHARAHAKYDYDLIQIIAIHYLSLLDAPNAERLFSVLVNERKNLPLNGKLLSRIYIERNQLKELDRLRRKVGQENMLEPGQPLNKIGNKQKGEKRMSELPLCESDTDLVPLLRKCKNEDLDPLVQYILQKGWLSSELELTEVYKKNQPNHMAYADEISSEIQRFGGHTFANWFRGRVGVTYKSIVCAVAKRLKVNFNKNREIEVIEEQILLKILEKAWEKMTDEEKTQLLKASGAKGVRVGKEFPITALQAIFKAGGFKSYQIMLIVANAVWKFIFGKGLPLVANAALARWAAVLTGPIGWAITAIWTVFDLGSPAYRVTIPCVIHIAMLRQLVALREAGQDPTQQTSEGEANTRQKK